MHRRFVLPFLMVIAVLLVNGQARAAGYALYEFSARGDALGGAMVGRADDPSAIAYNPAGITQLPGAQVMAGMTVIAPSAEVKTPFGTESAKDNVWFPPHAYYTQQLNDKWWFGMGLFSRFGLATEFSDDWAGRYNNYYAHIKSASLNPVLAYKVTDELSLAAGVEAMWFQFTQKKNIDPTGTNNPLNDPANDIRSKLDGTAYAPGLTAAVHYKPLSWLAMGATYRSQMELDVQGWADFTKPGSVPLPPSYFDSTHASGPDHPAGHGLRRCDRLPRGGRERGGRSGLDPLVHLRPAVHRLRQRPRPGRGFLHLGQGLARHLALLPGRWNGPPSPSARRARQLRLRPVAHSTTITPTTWCRPTIA